MWFKNLKIYQLTQHIDFDPETLETALEEQAFQPCGPQEPSRLGWIAPLGRASTSLLHCSQGHILLCARKQERLLPANVVKEQLEEMVLDIEGKEARKVYRKEQMSLKDEIIFSLMPKAFTRSKNLTAYIDTKRQLIIVNTASSNQAEELLNLLRESLDMLPLVPLASEQDVSLLLTDWLQKQPPRHFHIGGDCELQDNLDEKNRIRCKNQELSATEIKQHLDVGKQVIQLSMDWQERISFNLQQDLTIKQLKFEDIIIEQLEDDNADDQAAYFDSCFSLMVLEIGAFLDALLKQFAVENQLVA